VSACFGRPTGARVVRRHAPDEPDGYRRPPSAERSPLAATSSPASANCQTAAALLDRLGFERVYDYASSKVDYLARGLPREGEKAGERRAVDALRKDVVRCAPGDSIEEARARIEASPFGFGLVVDENGVLLGRLRRSALEQSEDGTVEQLMEVGPSPVRADVRAEELRDRHYAGWRAPGGRPAFGFVGASVAGLRCDRFTPQAE
jgi:hypothetical protein